MNAVQNDLNCCRPTPLLLRNNRPRNTYLWGVCIPKLLKIFSLGGSTPHCCTDGDEIWRWPNSTLSAVSLLRACGRKKLKTSPWVTEMPGRMLRWQKSALLAGLCPRLAIFTDLLMGSVDDASVSALQSLSVRASQPVYVLDTHTDSLTNALIF